MVNQNKIFSFKMKRQAKNVFPRDVERTVMAFQLPYARTDIYKYSFFPGTIRGWNASIISSAERSEDPVARFTSLMRSRDLSLQSLALVSECLMMYHQ